MKTTLTAFLFAVLLLPALNANSQQIIQSQCIGTIESEFAHEFIATSDGGYIVVGYTVTPPGMVSTTNIGGKDFLVTKINSEGIVSWQKNFGGTRDDEAFSVAETPSNEYIIIGTSYSDDVDVTDHIGSNDSSDVWLLSLNSSGQITWSKSYGGYGNDTAVDISLCSTNKILIAGNRSTENSVDGQLDYWLTQLDFNGNVFWQEFYGGDNDDVLQKMLWTSDDDIYLGGSSYSFGENEFDGETYVLKVDQYGDVTWEISFGSSSDAGTGTVSDMSLSEDEVLTISRVSALEPDEFSCGAHGSFQYARITTDGEIIDHWCYGGSGTDKSENADTDAEGNYWLTGTTNSADGEVNSPNGYVDEETNVWIAKTDYEGNLMWNASIGGSSTEEAAAMLIDDDGNIVLLANTNSSNGEVENQHDLIGETYDIWFVKLNPLLTGKTELKHSGMKLYPNPANEFLNIQWNEYQGKPNFNYRIYSSEGTSILSGQILSRQFDLNIQPLSPGIYTMQVMDLQRRTMESIRFLKI